MEANRVAILTTDRYWPWDGSHPNRSDRIWGSLDVALSLPFLVYRSRPGIIDARDFSEDLVIDGTRRTWRVRVFFLSAVVRSIARAIRFRNQKFLLLASRRRVLPDFVWYWSYAQLRAYLESQNLNVLMFHGEFNAWGRSVAWACQDSGVAAIAWQHGVLGPLPTSKPVRNDDRLPLPQHLIVWSEYAFSQRERSLARHVRTSIGGTLRFGYSREVSTPRKSSRVLLCPSTSDIKDFLNLAADKSAFPVGSEVAFRMHPLRKLPRDWASLVELDSNDVEASLSDCRAVIAGLSSIAIEALMRGIPVLVPRYLPDVSKTPFTESRPGIFLCDSPQEIHGVLNSVLRDGEQARSRYASTARYFAQAVDAENIFKVIDYVLDGQHGRWRSR